MLKKTKKKEIYLKANTLHGVPTLARDKRSLGRILLLNLN